jgi:DTW domain-containing protein YfiP
MPLSKIPPCSFSKLVVIDGTWQQAKQMARQEAFSVFRRVHITERKTLFWRFQQLDEYFLSTIEAIYYFFRDYFDTYESVDLWSGRKPETDVETVVRSREGSRVKEYDGK